MNYRNVKTGAVIKTTGKVIGKNWEPVEDTRSSVDDLHDDDIVDDIPDIEPAAEELPDEKPAAKTARKGKK